MLRSFYVFLITAATFVLAALALFFFVTMNSAQAQGLETISDSNRGPNHFGRGFFRTTGGQNLTFASYAEIPRQHTIAQGDSVGVNFATAAMPPWLHKYVELEIGTYKILVYAHKMNITANQSTYKIRGEDMLPKQRYNVEMEVKSQTAQPNERFARRRRCQDGRYYFQLFEREFKIQSVSMKFTDPQHPATALATLATARTRVTSEISKGNTSCTTSLADPTAPIISTGSDVAPPVAR